MEPTTEIDATGLLCPLPVLRLRKRMQRLPEGARVLLLTDDPAAVVDVPHFCTEAGHRLETTDRAGDILRFTIVKNGAS